MERAVIVSAVRTPVGSFGGYFKDVGAPELGSHAIRAALERAHVAPEDVEVPATTINMLCGSGLKSVTLASQMIRAGDADIVVAGGMENMSRSPYLVPTNRFGARMGDVEMIDSMTHDGRSE